MKQVILLAIYLGCVYGGGLRPGHYVLLKVPSKQGGAAQFTATHGVSGQSSVEGPPSPYAFNYRSDADGGGSSSRQETGDGSGRVTGSYSVASPDGQTREVSYVADKGGFKANVRTNEAGTANASPADVQFQSSAVAGVGHGIGTGGKGYGQASGTSSVSHHHSTISQTQQSYVPSSLEGPPSPYNFNYHAQLEDGSSTRRESGDSSGRVSGSYSLSVNDGRTRQVDYVADATGFKANVKTNEQGTKSENPAEVSFLSSAPLPAPGPVPTYNTGGAFSKTSHGAATQYHATSSGSAFGTGGAQIHFSPPLVSGPGDAPAPYNFNYDAKIDLGRLSQREFGDNTGKVTGSYSFSVDDGRNRQVDYIADAGGFRASVKTNEPGTKSESPADVQFYSSAPVPNPAVPSYHGGATVHGGASTHGGAVTHGGAISHKGGATHQFQSTSSAIPGGQLYISPPLASGPGDAPAPYNFNYDAQIDLGRIAQSEAGDSTGRVAGSYSFSVDDGRHRQVDYVADAGGFKASVKTNEPGTKSENPADISLYSSAPAVPVFPVGGAQQYGGSSIKGGAVHTGGASYNYQTGASSVGGAGPQAPLESGPPSPYSFSYNADSDTGSSSRRESGDGTGRVTGSYTVKDKDGNTRVVDYVADKEGFKANVQTNEPGTKSEHPADVVVHSSAPVNPVQPAQGSLFPPVSSYSGVKGSSAKKYVLVPYQGQGQW